MSQTLELEGIAKTIFEQRYAYPGETTWRERARVIARTIASAESPDKVESVEQKFYDTLRRGDLVPGGRITYGSGRKEQNLLNCYVIIPEDNVQSIGKLLQDVYRISCGGGGIGFNFSKLRPKGDAVRNIPFSAPGSVSVMKMINEVGEHVRAGAARRTALMSILNVTHPDLLEFLTVKLDKKQLTNFNISVAITDRFIDAVEKDEEWYFTFNNRRYDVYDVDKFDKEGNLIETLRIPALSKEDARGRAEGFYRTSFEDTFVALSARNFSAREIWNIIIENSLECGDPGIFQIDLTNRYTNVSYFARLDATNPCHSGSSYLLTDKGFKTFNELYLSQENVNVVQDTRVNYTGPSIDENNPVYWNVDVSKKKLGFEINKASPVRLTKHNTDVVKVITKQGLELICTPDHHIATKRGMVEAQHLTEKDEVLVPYTPIFSKEDIEQDSVAYKVGLLYGLLVGDGTVSRKDGIIDKVKLCFWDEHKYCQQIEELICELYEKTNTDLRWTENHSTRIIKPITSTSIRGDNTVISSTYLLRLFRQYGLLNSNSKDKFTQIPIDRTVFIGFIEGLFFSDGTVGDGGSSGTSLRISSSNKDMLQQIQRRMLEFGSYGKIYKRRDSGLKSLPDGKGGHKEYQCNADYEIIFGGKSRNILFELISLHGNKLNTYNRAIGQYDRKNVWDKRFANVEKVIPNGKEDVFCLSENKRRTIVVNGITNRRCGEQPLESYANCCLGHINLANMVDEEICDVDWKRLADAVRTAVRFLDNTLSINHFPIEECRDVGNNSRRIGIGFTGLHYMLIKLGLRYGSEDAVEFCERLGATLRNEAYNASVNLAKEKGSFPAFDRDKFLQEEFAKTLPARIRHNIRNYGIRNALLLTVAPVGTMSMVMGTSTGIEPIFAAMYKRRYRKDNVWAEEIVVDPLFKSYYENDPQDPRLDLFVGAYDVSPEEHLRTQAAFQQFIDGAISKTCNLPSNYQAEDLSELILSHAKYIKGFTVYRAGSKGNEPLEAIPLSEENIRTYMPQVASEEQMVGTACSLDGTGDCG